MKVTLTRLDDAFHFEARGEGGVAMHFDASPDIGGHGLGVRPMQALLMAVGSCSAIDVLSILKKQRQHVTGCQIEIDGARQQGVEPSLWEKVHVIFVLEGEIAPEKAQRAVQLSLEKYCSVSKTLECAGATITWAVRLNGQPLN